MIEHPLDRVVRLAGIGRSEDRDEARCGTEQGHDTWYRVETALGQEQAATKKARSSSGDSVAARHNQIFTIMPLIPNLCSARLRRRVMTQSRRRPSESLLERYCSQLGTLLDRRGT